MRRFESCAGVSLLEMMVVLSILALVLSAAAWRLGTATTGPNLRSSALSVVAKVEAMRREAIETGSTVSLTVPGADCQSKGDVRLVYFRDGSVRGQDLCVRQGDQAVRLPLDHLTGLLDRSAVR